MSSPIVIDKTNTVSVCGDVVFFEVDGVLLNWKTYTFKVSFDGPGTKGEDPEGADPEVTMCVETSETVKAEETEEDTSVKFEEEDTVVCDSENVKLELDGISACINEIMQCTALPNLDPTTSAIMLAEMKPWCHIVRPFSPSQIPEQVAKLEDVRQGRTRPIKWAGF
ncbi:hypothetical protein DFH29DRAFT_1006744 [Suillus ampliporus]|nr:hypothetical protein DFH29DRAFT_1006744 [Suillus ampliporus]